jgi:cyclophilin family peptidyl-prolyl cis-trans isomerase
MKTMLFLLLPAALAAQELQIATDKPGYVLNEDIQIEATLKNNTSGDLQNLPAFRVPMETFTLKAGRSASLQMKVPTLAVGKLEITAKYKDLKSNTVAVEIKPYQGTGGEQKEVACLITFFSGEKKTFTFDLIPEQGLNSVNHFVSLSKKGFYNGLRVFRVVNKNWIQSGCPYDRGHGHAGVFIKNESEAQKDKLKHDLGTLSLCSGSTRMGHCSSQFFICQAALPNLDGKFPIVARIVDDQKEGLKEMLGGFQASSDSDRPSKDIVIEKIEIVTR